jgi:phosphoglycolate phosphatase-like HAD superfamily hydrolase
VAVFDIDHTLVDVLRFHEAAFRRTLAVAYGVRVELRAIDFSGETTVNLLRRLAAFSGLSDHASEAGLGQALAVYCRVLVEELDPDLRGHLLPGVRELLTLLDRRGVLLGVASGNPRAVGLEVLRRADLLHHFSVTAFGDEAVDRAGVVAIALTRAATVLGSHLRPASAVVIGDSVRDVEAGRAAGARTMALATGLSSWAELSAARPDHLLADLADVEQAARLILRD